MSSNEPVNLDSHVVRAWGRPEAAWGLCPHGPGRGGPCRPQFHAGKGRDRVTKG